TTMRLSKITFASAAMMITCEIRAAKSLRSAPPIKRIGHPVLCAIGRNTNSRLIPKPVGRVSSPSTANTCSICPHRFVAIRFAVGFSLKEVIQRLRGMLQPPHMVVRAAIREVQFFVVPLPPLKTYGVIAGIVVDAAPLEEKKAEEMERADLVGRAN